MRIRIGHFLSFMYPKSAAIVEESNNRLVYRGIIDSISTENGLSLNLAPVEVTCGEINFHDGAYRNPHNSVISFDGVWEPAQYNLRLTKEHLIFQNFDHGLIGITKPGLTILCYPNPIKLTTIS